MFEAVLFLHLHLCIYVLVHLLDKLYSVYYLYFYWFVAYRGMHCARSGLRPDCVYHTMRLCTKMEAPCSYGFVDLIMTARASHRVFTTKSPPLWSWIICSPLPQLCGITVVFLGPVESGGDQMKKSHLASPSKVSQS